MAYATRVDDYHQRAELHISRGNPTQTERITPDVDWFPLAEVTDGRRGSYFFGSAFTLP